MFNFDQINKMKIDLIMGIVVHLLNIDTLYELGEISHKEKKKKQLFIIRQIELESGDLLEQELENFRRMINEKGEIQ